MKLIVLLVGLLFSQSLEAFDLTNYTLVWNDEFNADTLDITKWKISEGARFGAINTKDSIYIENGCLIIAPYTKDGIHYAGTISTEGLFEDNYGYWEAKVKFGTEPGAWSDIWLYSQTVASIEDDIDKAGAEIDIFEHRATDGFNRYIAYNLVHGIHYNGYSYKHQNFASDAYFESDPATFHILGFKWDLKSYTFYLDGRETWSTKKGLTSKPLFAIISVEIKDHFWAGDILPQAYKGNPMITVDYIRYYKEKTFKFELPFATLPPLNKP